MAAHRADNDTANNLRNYTTPRDSYRFCAQVHERSQIARIGRSFATVC
jgi:hypothetical protein